MSVLSVISHGEPKTKKKNKKKQALLYIESVCHNYNGNKVDIKEYKKKRKKNNNKALHRFFRVKGEKNVLTLSY